MLTLNDGRSELWQWDTGRKLTVVAECSQVHFSNKVFGRSIDVDVVDGVAIIPDILLQTDKELTAWAFVGTPENGYTKISKVFKVNRRNKPADYVFTPTEQTTLEEIKEKLDYLESIQDPDAIKNAVEDYLKENPVVSEESDPTVPEWAKHPEKPRYTAEEIGALPDDTQIPEIPKNVSAFENDAGYLTEHQDLSDYAKKDEIPSSPADIGAQPAGNYALRTELPLELSQLSEDSTHRTVTDAEKNQWNNKSEFSGDYRDLINKPEIPVVPVRSVNGKTGDVLLTAEDVNALPEGTPIPSKTSDLSNDSGFVTVAVATLLNYYLKSETFAKSETYSRTDIDNLINGLESRLDAFFDTDDETLDQMSELVAYINSNKSLIDSITTSKVSVADIINNLTTNVSNKPLSAAQGVVLKGLIDGLSTGKLDANKLPEAINTALAQAKESGEFDGADGQRGTGLLYITTAPSSYTTTTGGFTPVYRISLSTVLTQSKAEEVLAGDLLSYSYYHYPVGYVDTSYVYLGTRKNIRGATGASVTVTSVSESTEDGGSNVVTFSDGKEMTVKNGKTGTAGKTPVKGTDYFTEADKTELVSAVIAALPDAAEVSY